MSDVDIDVDDEDEDDYDQNLAMFKYALSEERGVSEEELTESDAELYQLWDDRIKAERLKEIRAKTLIKTPEGRFAKRLNNTEKVLRWLIFYRHSRFTILASVLDMKDPESARIHCKKMLKHRLVKEVDHDVYGGFGFLLYGITKAGLDEYYLQSDNEPRFRSKRVFKLTDGIATNMRHDHMVQWVHLYLESIDYEAKETQYWLSDYMLPRYTPPGKKKHPDAWPTYPDGIFKNSPFSWRGPDDLPPGYTTPLDKQNMYENLTSESKLLKDGTQGDYGYLNLAIEVEKTIKSPQEYVKLIAAHELNIKKGRYDAVLYLRSSKTKTAFLDNAFSSHLRNIYEPIQRANDIVRSENHLNNRDNAEPLWEKHKRKFIFDTYEQYIKKYPKKQRKVKPKNTD